MHHHRDEANVTAERRSEPFAGQSGTAVADEVDHSLLLLHRFLQNSFDTISIMGSLPACNNFRNTPFAGEFRRLSRALLIHRRYWAYHATFKLMAR
jgi:hypothetical protein